MGKLLVCGCWNCILSDKLLGLFKAHSMYVPLTSLVISDFFLGKMKDSSLSVLTGLQCP